MGSGVCDNFYMRVRRPKFELVGWVLREIPYPPIQRNKGPQRMQDPAVNQSMSKQTLIHRTTKK